MGSQGARGLLPLQPRRGQQSETCNHCQKEEHGDDGTGRQYTSII
jgi:hypothetical protein